MTGRLSAITPPKTEIVSASRARSQAVFASLAGDAARVGVLDRDTGRSFEFPDQRPSRVRIGVIVEAHFLTGQHSSVENRAVLIVQSLERCVLMRILAVTQSLEGLEVQALSVWFRKFLFETQEVF